MKSPRNIACMNELEHGIMIRHHRKLLNLLPVAGTMDYGVLIKDYQQAEQPALQAKA
jgi:hypothetical protein